MTAAYYSGHDLEWTKKFIEALPKKKGLDYAKAVCIAAVLQHKYTLEKKNEVILDSKILKSFGVTKHNLEKYLPYFEQAGLIDWVRKKGAAAKIILISLPPNYKKVNGTISTNRINRIIEKGTSPTVAQVTSPTVAQVTSPTVAQVEKPSREWKQGMEVRHGSKEWKQGMGVRHGSKEWKQGMGVRHRRKGGKKHER